MSPKTLTRNAVDLYLRTTLAPWQAVGRFARLGGDRTSPLEVAVGRVDAAVREFVGRAISDEELLADAERRRVAADNRAVAIELHTEAERREQEAEERRRQREEQAEHARARAEEQAEKKREATEQTANERRQAVRKAASSRKQSVKKAAARKREAIDEAARDARLEELREKEAALDAEEQAVTEEQRAARLKQSAEATRRARTSR